MNLYNDKIKFIHYRRMYNGKPLARGGMTVAYFVNDDGSIKWETSRCSDKDNFSYAEGRKWAVTRLKHGFVDSTRNTKRFRSLTDAFARSMGYERVFSRKNRPLRYPECAVPAGVKTNAEQFKAACAMGAGDIAH